MAEEEPKPALQPVLAMAASVPTLYIDTVANIAINSGTARMYCLRFDPSLKENEAPRATVVAQLIIPTNAFVSLAVFFQMQIDQMLKTEEISETDLKKLRADLEGALKAKSDA